MPSATTVELLPVATNVLLTRNPCKSHARARRARNAVLTGLFVFTALLALAYFSIDGPQRDPVYYQRWSRLIRQIHASPEKPFTVVMLGSSRTAWGFRPMMLQEPLTRALNRPVVVGNFGLPGCCASMHLLTWNRLLRDGVRPDLVLIEVMPAMLMESWYPNELTAERFPVCRLRFGDLPVLEKHFSDIRPGLRNDWWLAQPSTFFDYRLTLLSRFAPGLLPLQHRVALETQLVEELPATVVEVPRDVQQRKLKSARDQYAAGLQDFHLGGRCCADFHELVAQVQRDGVQVVLVVMPEGSEFRSWYKPGDFGQVWELLDKMRAELGIQVIDAHEWLAEDDFLDSHHPNPPGGAKFTARLGEYLVPLLHGRSDSAGGNGPRASAR